MDVFIIWSGDVSKAVAKALYVWLPFIIQAVKPWMSEEDIDKGAQWPEELRKKLKEPNFGIVCLTPDNLVAPWILFESGALLNSLSNARLSPYLFELKKANITWPLAQLQMTEAEKEDTLKLIKSINKILGEEALEDKLLEKNFETYWPELKQNLEKIKKNKEKKLEDIKTQRSLDEKIDDILQIVRILSREQREQLERTIQEKANNMGEILKAGEISRLAKLAGQRQISKAFENVAREIKDVVNVHEFIDPLEKDKEEKSE